jgi:serine/threonine protein kinase
MRANLPDPSYFIDKPLPHNPRYVITEYIKSGNNGHVFRAFSDTTGHQLACKIVPFQNLPRNNAEQNLWLQEAKKGNKLNHPSVVRCDDVVPWSDDGAPGQFVVFTYEYVAGISLKEYLQNNNEITIGFIEEFLRTILGLFHEMQGRGIEHGDLHAGNIIVADKSPYDVDPRTTFRVIDFGVQAITSSMPAQSDFLQLAGILRDLLTKVDYQAAGPQDRHEYNVFRHEFLQRHLIEADTTVDALAQNPKALYEKLNRLGTEYEEMRAVPEMAKLRHPFDYPNCEQMGNSHLLLKSLYSTRFLGLGEVESKSNLVLTGPRGCGKSMVFKAMSLEHRVSVDEDDVSNVNYVGIYYRCDDLYFSFPRYKHPSREEAINVAMHFMVVTLLAQVLSVTKQWATKRFHDEIEKAEPRIAKGLWKLLEWNPPDEPGAERFERLIAKLNRERDRSARKYRVAHDLREKFGQYFGPEKLLLACQLIRSELGFLSARPFYFFIDDYSEPKITADLQENLNRLFMYRSPDCYFKISTESPVSYVTRDIDGKSYVEAREFNLLNLGILYIKDGGKETLPFLDDLFARRFREVNDYPVFNLDELIGSQPRNENELARQIGTGNPPSTYFGKETLAALCSGDIHYMIRLVGRMVEENGGVAALRACQDLPKIKSKDQHGVIRAAAGDFLESVRMLPKHGVQLAAIVTAIGSVARSLLLYQTSKNEKGNPPLQASRIEPYEALNLSEEADSLLKELLRYSIFLYDPRGKSRRGHVVPRLYLRRYLLPHFNLTFSQRDSIELENSEIEQLLTQPQEFEKHKRLKVKKGDDKTVDMFIERPNGSA